MQNGKSKKKYYGIVGAVTFAALFSIFINEASSEAKENSAKKDHGRGFGSNDKRGERDTFLSGKTEENDK